MKVLALCVVLKFHKNDSLHLFSQTDVGLYKKFKFPELNILCCKKVL